MLINGVLKYIVCLIINYYVWVGDKRIIYFVKLKISFIWRLIDYWLRVNKLGIKWLVILCGEEWCVNLNNSCERGFMLNDKLDLVLKFVWGKILFSEWLMVNIKLYFDFYVIYVSFKCFIWEYLF